MDENGEDKNRFGYFYNNLISIDGAILGGLAGVTSTIFYYIVIPTKIELLKIGAPLVLMWSSIGYFIGQSDGIKNFKIDKLKLPPQNPIPIVRPYMGPTWKYEYTPFNNSIRYVYKI